MTPPAAAPRPRLAALDLARGLALVAMIIYHFAWDLSFLGLIAADIRDIPGWIWFARAIAATFLALVGVSLVLAHRDGFDRRAFLRRLVMIAGAAGLVTAGTAIVLPDSFVFFGILHAIALGSVLALPFLRLPRPVILLAAIIVFALPEFVRLEAFSSPWLIWLGLGTRVPTTNDFVPVFPWFGFILAGMVLARSLDPARLPARTTDSPPARLLSRAGQNSLAIYLLHQPILFGALSLLALAILPRPDPDAAGFLSSCQAQCRSSGGDVIICTNLCRCAVEALKAEGLWAAALADRMDGAQKARMEAISRRCAETGAAAGVR
jgi:uncharacterized membrane protein